MKRKNQHGKSKSKNWCHCMELVLLEEFQKRAIFPSGWTKVITTARYICLSYLRMSVMTSSYWSINPWLGVHSGWLPTLSGWKHDKSNSLLNMPRCWYTIVDSSNEEIAVVQSEISSEVLKLKTQIQKLTAQVTTMTTQKNTKKQILL